MALVMLANDVNITKMLKICDILRILLKTSGGAQCTAMKLVFFNHMKKIILPEIATENEAQIKTNMKIKKKWKNRNQSLVIDHSYLSTMNMASNGFPFNLKIKCSFHKTLNSIQFAHRLSISHFSHLCYRNAFSGLYSFILFDFCGFIELKQKKTILPIFYFMI